MPLSNNPQVQDTTPPGNSWSPWHQNFVQQLYKQYAVHNVDPNTSTVDGYNTTTKTLQQVIADALQQGRSLRALGGTWSMSPVAATDGILLDTRYLNYWFGLTAQNLDPAYKGDSTKKSVWFVQAGTSVADLNRRLEGGGFALQTSGASNGQTIAGALSTGTHGAALQFGSVPTYVVGLHLITAPDQSVWLERQSYPVVRQDVALGFGAKLMRDDDKAFDAALVSFGSFGLLHGVLIEASKKYKLNLWRNRIDLSAEMWNAIASGDFTGVALPGNTDRNGSFRQPWHFQLVWNPFDTDQPERPLATIMYQIEDGDPQPANPNPPDPIGSGLGDSGAEIIAKLTDLAGGISVPLSRLIEKFDAFSSRENVLGTPGQIFSDTTTRGKSTSSAMAFKAADVKTAWDLAAQIIRDRLAPALLSIRLVKPGQGMLGFIRHEPLTAILEVDGPDSDRVRDADHRIWDALRSQQIPFTFHWGKANDMTATPTIVNDMYGTDVPAWTEQRKRLLTTPELRRVFANDFLRRMQIAD